jgi:hypothetical protein
VEHVLIIVQFASDFMALAAAVTTLADAAFRRRNRRTRKG